MRAWLNDIGEDMLWALQSCPWLIVVLWLPFLLCFAADWVAEFVEE